MNPYDFVPVDFEREITRRPPVPHHTLVGVTGEIECEVVAETPIFIKKGQNVRDFLTNKHRQKIIPSSSLKGLFRSLVETVGHGCFGGKFDGIYRDRVRGAVNHTGRLPESFKNCPGQGLPPLCIACRMFGWLNGDSSYGGKVFFSDALAVEEVSHPAVFTVDLMGPKPHHTAFYLDPAGRCIAGRKYYFHFPWGINTRREGGPYNQEIRPLDKGSRFRFRVSFTNLEADETAALLYALDLEGKMRHKVGYAKPSGLGSVKIRVTRLHLWDSRDRYLAPGRGVIDYNQGDSGDELRGYILDKISPFTGDRESVTLNGLRRVWKWDTEDPTPYRYPDQAWFNDNPTARIAETP